MATVKRIPADEIKGGAIVLRFDRSGVPYDYYARDLPAGMVQSVKKTLAENRVKFAFVRETAQKEKEKNRAAGVLALLEHMNRPIAQVPPPGKTAPEDVVTAREMHDRARLITKDIMSQVRMGNAVDTDASREVVSGLVESCFKNPETFVNLSRLKNFDNYTFTHSVNVAVIAISIGRKLGMSYGELRSLGLAGLLHDVGKMKVPERIINKPGKLTDEEFLLMKMHPVYGYELLRTDSGVPPETVKAVLQHHEKSDGTGYPYGLKEREISKYAKIIAIADVYDAITSERAYHKGIGPADALKMLFAWSGKHFNEVLVKFFISLIGIYPAGTAVMLDTGEIARGIGF